VFCREKLFTLGYGPTLGYAQTLASGTFLLFQEGSDVLVWQLLAYAVKEAS
jgi:hypothetical protein